MSKKDFECPYDDGAQEFLERFSTLLPLYLASGTPQEELEQIVDERKLRKYFKVIWGSPPGTKEQFIKNALQAEDCKPPEAIYIGDMLDDLKLAQTTGTLFVGRELKESFEKFDIPTFPDLRGIMEWVQYRIPK